MAKYKELWNHLREVDGARKLEPHTCFYEKLKELMDYIEGLYDRRGEKNFKRLDSEPLA